MSIEFLRFHPVKRSNSLVGFASFKYNGIGFSEIAVHKMLNPKNGITARLRYPANIKPHSDMQQDIDREISAYILVNYKECLKEQHE